MTGQTQSYEGWVKYNVIHYLLLLRHIQALHHFHVHYHTIMSIDTVPRAPHSKVFTDIFPVTKNKKKRKNINRYNRCKNCLLLLKPALSNSKSIIKKRGGKENLIAHTLALVLLNTVNYSLGGAFFLLISQTEDKMELCNVCVRLLPPGGALSQTHPHAPPIHKNQCLLAKKKQQKKHKRYFLKREKRQPLVSFQHLSRF